MHSIWRLLMRGGLWRLQVNGRYVVKYGKYFVTHPELFSAFSFDAVKGASNDSTGPAVALLAHENRPLWIGKNGWLTSFHNRSLRRHPLNGHYILHQLSREDGGDDEFFYVFHSVRNETLCLAQTIGNSSVVYGDEPDSSSSPPVHLVASSSSCGAANNPQTVFRLEALTPMRPKSNRAGRPFDARVRDAAIVVGGRRVVVASYTNIARIDIGVVSWRWLNASGVNRLLLLDIDGRTCAAAKRLRLPVHVLCARETDLSLPTRLQGRSGNGLGAGLADAVTGAYQRMLHWKLRLMQHVMEAQLDVLLLDVDVLVLSPELLNAFVLPTERIDLVVSSDARTESTLSNGDCPFSLPGVGRQVSASWVCAGLMYMRASNASLWFIKEAQLLMEEFGVTDQDAIQALLTGTVQISRPSMKPKLIGGVAPSLAGSWIGRGNRNVWSRAVAWEKNGSRAARPSRVIFFEWLNERRSGRTPRLSPQSAPQVFSAKLRRAYAAEKMRRGFQAKIVQLEVAANGPVVHNGWKTRYGTSSRAQNEETLSVHFNCNTKRLLLRDQSAASWLFRPPYDPGVSHGLRTHAHRGVRRRWYSPLLMASGTDVGDLFLY